MIKARRETKAKRAERRARRGGERAAEEASPRRYQHEEGPARLRPPALSADQEGGGSWKCGELTRLVTCTRDIRQARSSVGRKSQRRGSPYLSHESYGVGGVTSCLGRCGGELPEQRRTFRRRCEFSADITHDVASVVVLGRIDDEDRTWRSACPTDTGRMVLQHGSLSREEDPSHDAGQPRRAMHDGSW